MRSGEAFEGEADGPYEREDGDGDEECPEDAAPKGLTETGATYAVDLACPPPGTVWEIRVEDDDGRGLEGWITTGRFRLREPMRLPSHP